MLENSNVTIKRTWAMPNKDTHKVVPIYDFMVGYLQKAMFSIDPFARDCELAHYRNDLNPNTKATSHLDSLMFLKKLEAQNDRPDLVIFDPPYSPEQMKRAYDSFGLKMAGRDALRTAGWKDEKDVIAKILTDKGIVLSFGWNSSGMGEKRGFEIIEILLVCHGAGHHDTICMAERRIDGLFNSRKGI
jgi:hypothetical protein